jgi:hypothetical protein
MAEKPPKLSVLARQILAAIRNIGSALQEQNKKNADANKRAEMKQSVIPEVRVDVVHLPPTTETQESAREASKDRTYKRCNVWISGLTFIAVVIYAGLAYEQWRAMANAADAAFDAVHEARQSRQQATRVLDATIEQFRLDQRAWLSVTDISIKNTVTPGKRFVWIGYIQNTGKTPALNAIVLFKSKTFLKGETPKFVYDGTANQLPGRMVLAPSVKISVFGHENLIDLPLTVPQVEAMRAGVTTMYIYGKIEYDDIFKEKRRTTHVCAWLDTDLATTHPCNIYNDAD